MIPAEPHYRHLAFQLERNFDAFVKHSEVRLFGLDPRRARIEAVLDRRCDRIEILSRVADLYR